MADDACLEPPSPVSNCAACENLANTPVDPNPAFCGACTPSYTLNSANQARRAGSSGLQQGCAHGPADCL